MGEAKRRAKFRKETFVHSKALKRARFNVLAIGTRLSMLFGMATEVSWWSSLDERLIGVVAFDHTDNDYNALIMARDQIGRFRCIDVQTSFPKEFDAETALRFKIAKLIAEDKIEQIGAQGDETNAPIDLFQLPTDFDPSKLHPYFRLLLEDPGRKPARAVIREIGPWLAPQDPHLVKEFQTKGFDQRLWEIYLWAALKEFALDVEQLEAPDFRCTGRGHDFTLEATTVAPSMSGELAAHPNPETPEEIEEFLKGYMPLKYGSALTTKLNKTNQSGEHYWEREQTLGKPFVLAIADFHEPPEKDGLGSMTYTQTALWNYLYGHRVNWEQRGDQIFIKEEAVQDHKFGKKTAPSCFFDLPNAENIAAVIFSNAGTLAKFDRIGVAAGYGAEGYRYMRMGLRYDPNPEAVMGIPFSVDAGDPDYEEFWTQEVQVFHNPNAQNPLPFDALLGASHHYFEDDTIQSIMPEDAILSSMTMVMKILEK